MELPKISVITASYNSGETIEQTIFSVISQDYSRCEFIIIDGASTDTTLEIIKRYENKIDKYVSEPDMGIYDALNKGVRLATGDYIIVLGADDCFVDVSILSKVAEELDEDVDILSAPVWFVDEETNLQYMRENISARNKKTYDYRMIPHQGMFVRRELMLKRPFDLRFCIVADYMFFLSCYFDESVRFKYIDFPVVFYSLGGISSQSSRLFEHVKENNLIREHFELPLLAMPVESNYFFKRVLKKLHLIGISRYLRNRWIRGQKPHKCDWKICRWCGRGV